MTKEGNSSQSANPRKHRALVLQGGGALGAYEAGVLEVLCKKLTEDDKEVITLKTGSYLILLQAHP